MYGRITMLLKSGGLFNGLSSELTAGIWKSVGRIHDLAKLDSSGTERGFCPVFLREKAMFSHSWVPGGISTPPGWW
jgi:hypothetical protein